MFCDVDEVGLGRDGADTLLFEFCRKMKVLFLRKIPRPQLQSLDQPVATDT